MFATYTSNTEMYLRYYLSTVLISKNSIRTFQKFGHDTIFQKLKNRLS